MSHAVIVGAGIGGLTAALALRDQGWTVDVYEKAPRSKRSEPDWRSARTPCARST
ncbi:hypothetical protein GCM10029992_56510 [Glycomyces albus]